MTPEEHLTLVQDTLEKSCLPLLRKKGFEYSRSGDAANDTLANFKRIAAAIGVDPLVVWLVYTHKHFDAIGTFVRETAAGRQYEISEPIEGRFVDALNYLFLGLGLLAERKDGSKRYHVRT